LTKKNIKCIHFAKLYFIKTYASEKKVLKETSTMNENVDKSNLPGPLDGIKIVECAIWHAGPGASAILGDMGAEVIKIETMAGDPERLAKQLGSVKFDVDADEEWSFLFELSNRNKKGICLDIKSGPGREILDRLVASADVFLTNLRNSTKPKLRIDYESLKKINPDIIHASVSGFGLEGPFSDVGGFDPMGQAISGMLYLTGDDEPVMLQTVVLDQMTSITASHAIMTALFYRERHGIGQEVHVSLYSSALWLTHANLLATGIMKKNPVEKWDRFKNTPLRNCFKCKDGKWIMGTNNPEEKFWERFCDLTGKPELKNDPRYKDTENRVKNAAALVADYDDLFATRTRDEWIKLFRDNGFMYAPVQRIEEVLEDPQAIENQYVVDFDHPILGKVKIPGYPVTFSANRAGTVRQAPGLGEHTDLVMKDMGYDDNEIQALKKSHVIK
jgi:crotonobetainyl-CoA:carnitine CoA-transferase CaiB-like acyl-CoA transferase